jgi:hypothetical protein
MKMPRWIVGSITAVSLAGVVVGLLGFAHTYSDVTPRCFANFASAQWPKWIGCAMAAHQDLAGGLIGLAGALFAAWLAYSGAQDQLRKTNEQLREASRLQTEAHLDQATADVKALSNARDYLVSFVGHFPEQGDFDFVQGLRGLNQRAHVYVSESASRAPGDFGRRILTEMWRIEKMANGIEIRDRTNQMSFQDLRDEIPSTIVNIRKIIVDLDDEIKLRVDRLANLREQVDNAKRG